MEIDASLCLRCGACASVCPLNVVEVSDTRVSIGEGCTDCGICIKACPMGAMMVERKI